MTFQISSSSEGPPSFGCPRHDLAVAGLAWTWRIWSRVAGTRQYKSKEAELADTTSPALSAP